jgi:hypothetical protein
MRIHQWPKNLLVFLPAVTSQRFHDYFLFLASLKAFLAFCATASAVYLINDVADLAHDRQHLAKRLRPFAAGTLSTKWCFATKTLPWSSEQLRIMQRAPEEGVPDILGADYVTLCDVLHHIPEKAKAPFLKDIVGQTRPGAALIVADIDAGRRAGSWMNQLHDLIVSQEWVAPVPAYVARTMLEQEGLIVREQSFVRSLWYPHYLILAEKPSMAGARPD